jgi:hypothetical protein
VDPPCRAARSRVVLVRVLVSLAPLSAANGERANHMGAQIAVRMSYPRRGRKRASVYEVEIGKVQPYAPRATRPWLFKRRNRSPIVETCAFVDRASCAGPFGPSARSSRIRCSAMRAWAIRSALG